MRRYRALENREPHDRAQAPAILGKPGSACFVPAGSHCRPLGPAPLSSLLTSLLSPFGSTLPLLPPLLWIPSDPGGSSSLAHRRTACFDGPAPFGPVRAPKAGRVDVNPAQLGHVWTRRRKACCGPHVTCGVSHQTSGRTEVSRCDCANAPRSPLETRRCHPVVGRRLVLRPCAVPGPIAVRRSQNGRQNSSAARDTFRPSGKPTKPSVKPTRIRAQPVVTIMKKQPALYVRDFDGARFSPRRCWALLQPGAVERSVGAPTKNENAW